MKTWSIKARATVAVTVLFVALVAAASGLQLHFLRSDFTDLAYDEQYASVERIAREIDARLETGLSALGATASYVEPALLDRPAELRRQIEGQPALFKLFDEVLVFDSAGRLLADHPHVEARVGLDISSREYFQRMVATGGAVVSPPLISKARKEPIVMSMAPMRAKDGTVIGAVAGVNRLYRTSFIGRLGEERIGDEGYYFILTRGPDPVYVSHPDPSRILKPRTAAGSEAVSRALAGFQGSAESVGEGRSKLYSSKLLRNVPWLLVAMTPTSQVFAPMHKAERMMLVIAGVTALAVIPLAWLSVWVLLAPLQRLRGSIVRLREAGDAFAPVPVERADEVGDLTDSFNRLMAQRHGAEAARRESEERLRLLADNMPALISYLDADLRVQYANSCYRDWFRIDPLEMVGKRPEEIFGAESHHEVREHHEGALAGYPATYERDIVTPTGPRSTRTVLFPCMDDQHRVVGIYRMTTDISGDRKVQRALDLLARRDTLTGLHNRRSFDEMLPAAIARSARSRRWIALLFIDLDRFKAVNDTLGHGAGDDVLKAVAERIGKCIRVTDTAVRLAGDEFTVVLENLGSEEEATLVAAKISGAVGAPIATRAGECSVSASIGIAGSSSGRSSPEELVRRADAAAYAAKAGGRGCYRLAEPEPAYLRLVQKA